MPTLISVHNCNGRKGACDATCYDAEGDDCTCICAGMNHGAGFEQARSNVQVLAGNGGLPQAQLHEFLQKNGNFTRSARVQFHCDAQDDEEQDE